MAVENFIPLWRKRQKWSQEKLAAVMTEIASTWDEPKSWGRTDVNKVENGRRDPDGAFLRACAAALRCTIGDLLENPPSDQPLTREELRELAETYGKVDKSDRPTALKILRQLVK